MTLIETRTRDLPSCSIVPQSTTTCIRFYVQRSLRRACIVHSLENTTLASLQWSREDMLACSFVLEVCGALIMLIHIYIFQSVRQGDNGVDGRSRREVETITANQSVRATDYISPYLALGWLVGTALVYGSKGWPCALSPSFCLPSQASPSN
jgi:hypothetical protein